MVGILENRKDIITMTNSILLVYLIISVIAVGVAVIIFLDKRPPGKDQ